MATILSRKSGASSGGGGAPSGPAGGDLTGTYPNPTLAAASVDAAAIDGTDAAAILTDLGVSAFVQTILDDANAAAALTTLGISAFVQTVLNDADAATVAATLGLGQWSDYTPALTAVTTNPTLGVASVVDGRYCRVGKMVTVQGSITFGTSGTNAGSGTYQFSLPSTVGANQAMIGGTLMAYDASAFDAFIHVALPVAGQAYFTAFWAQTATAAALSNASPVAWTASDAFWFSLSYEEA